MSHNERRENSPSASVTYIEPKWTSALALILAGLALGLSVGGFVFQISQMQDWKDDQAVRYRELERETRLLQLKVDDMAVALKARGIDPTPSHEGNSP